MLIVTDLDRTLLRADKTISPYNVKAIANYVCESNEN